MSQIRHPQPLLAWASMMSSVLHRGGWVALLGGVVGWQACLIVRTARAIRTAGEPSPRGRTAGTPS